MIERLQTIPLVDSAGLVLFGEAANQKKCLRLLTYFTTQENMAFCGPASATMVLNALEIERPNSPAHGKWTLFQQETLFTGPAKDVVEREQVGQYGMSLDTFGRVLDSYDELHIEIVFAEDLTLDAFRDRLVSAVAGSDNEFAVVNYHRVGVGQQGGGHISPLGAYHAGSDRFLILDVSRYKYPPIWVSTADLYKATAERSEGAERSRGFVVVGLERDR